MNFKRVPMILQHEEKDCGAACLSMIFGYHGLKLPLAKVAEACKTDQYGTNIYGLVDAADQYGMKGTALEGSAEDLYSEVSKGSIPTPFIARIVNEHLFEHYIVVRKITQSKVFLNDPGEGRKNYSIKEFSERFLGQVIYFEPTPNFKKENHRKGSMMEFIRLITKQKGLLAVVGVLSLFVTAIGMAGSFLFQYLIDKVLPSLNNHMHNHEFSGIESFAVLVLAVAILYIFRFIAQILRTKLLLFMGKRINLGLMLGYYDNVLDLKMDFFGSHKTGDLLSRFSDAGKVQEALANATLILMIDVVMVLFCGITLYRQSGELFAITFTILILYIIISAIFVRPLDKCNRKSMVDAGRLNAYLKETLSGVLTIKSTVAEHSVKQKTEQMFTTLQDESIKIGMVEMTRDSLIELMTSVGTLCLLWVGAVKIMGGEMTLGCVIMFYTMLSYFLTPIQNVLQLQNSLQAAVVAASRLRDVMDRTKEVNFSEGTSEFVNGDILFNDVNFRYGNRELVLENFSTEIHQGEHVAIVGPSGSGKTTVSKLLMNFYQAECGSVQIGGKDITEIDLNSLRKNISYVPQESFLFSDSVRNNLLLGNDTSFSDEAIFAILNSCGCAFVNDFPFGLDTMLEEDGRNLSGGQKQRLAIARVLLRSPNILLLDEATSNLDMISERALLTTLQTNFHDMTVIMIAHRLSTIKDCDKIIVLDEGKVAEVGTHEQLLNNNGMYAQLWGQA